MHGTRSPRLATGGKAGAPAASDIWLSACPPVTPAQMAQHSTGDRAGHGKPIISSMEHSHTCTQTHVHLSHTCTCSLLLTRGPSNTVTHHVTHTVCQSHTHHQSHVSVTVTHTVSFTHYTQPYPPPHVSQYHCHTHVTHSHIYRVSHTCVTQYQCHTVTHTHHTPCHPTCPMLTHLELGTVAASFPLT